MTTPEWRVFAVPEARLEVLLPGVPRKEHAMARTAHGPIQIYSHIVDAGQMAFGVLYSEYPDGFLQAMGPDPERILDLAVKAAVERRQGVLVSEKRIFFQCRPGTEVRFDYPEGTSPRGPYPAGIAFHRGYLIDGRMYLLQVDVAQDFYAAQQSVVDEAIARFWSSLSIDLPDESTDQHQISESGTTP